MLLKLKVTVFTIFCSLVLLSSAVSAQVIPDQKMTEKLTILAKPTPTPAVKESKIELPEIEGWEMGEMREYPTADLGYSVPYRSDDGGVVTIYVYNGGNKTIPSDVTNKLVKGEIERAKSDIVQIGKTGTYENVKEVKSETITLGGNTGKTKALYALFNFAVKGREVDSEIFLFAYQNNFIKIRATRPSDMDKESVQAAISVLLAEIDKAVSK